MVVVSGGGGNPWAKEMTIRRRMASIFNKTQEHFPSLRDYNDYLEEVEDMTFNLIEGIDVEAIEAKIARYEKENAEQIYLSRAKRAEDLAAALQASRMNPGKTEANDSATGSSQGISGGAGAQGQYAPAAVPGGLAQPCPNQSAVHLILFKETMRRPEDCMRREEHEQEDGLLNWVRKEHWRRRLAQYLSKDYIKRKLLTLDDP